MSTLYDRIVIIRSRLMTFEQLKGADVSVLRKQTAKMMLNIKTVTEEQVRDLELQVMDDSRFGEDLKTIPEVLEKVKKPEPKVATPAECLQGNDIEAFTLAITSDLLTDSFYHDLVDDELCCEKLRILHGFKLVTVYHINIMLEAAIQWYPSLDKVKMMKIIHKDLTGLDKIDHKIIFNEVIQYLLVN